MTCFDHYCAKHHVGLGLNSKTGKALRDDIEKAIKDTPGGLSRSLFKKGLTGTAHTMLSGPRNLFKRFSKFLDQDHKDEPQHLEVEVVDENTTFTPGKDPQGFEKVAYNMELQFSPLDNAYLEALITNFDRIHSNKS